MKNFLIACTLAGLAAIGSNLQAQTTVSFQPGVDGYEGLFDMVIGRNAGTTDPVFLFGDQGLLGSTILTQQFLDGAYGDFYEQADEKQGLFRFDGIIGSGAGQVPAGATILSAQLELTTAVVGNAQSGGAYGVSRLLVPFSANTTYNNVVDGLRFYDNNETDRPLPWGAVIAE